MSNNFFFVFWYEISGNVNIIRICSTIILWSRLDAYIVGCIISAPSTSGLRPGNKLLSLYFFNLMNHHLLFVRQEKIHMLRNACININYNLAIRKIKHEIMCTPPSLQWSVKHCIFYVCWSSIVCAILNIKQYAWLKIIFSELIIHFNWFRYEIGLKIKLERRKWALIKCIHVCTNYLRFGMFMLLPSS